MAATEPINYRSILDVDWRQAEATINGAWRLMASAWELADSPR